MLTIADDEGNAARLERLFTEQREAEWAEFLAEEVVVGKLTFAELDEEGQSLDRLRRWYRTITTRDLYGALAPQRQTGGSRTAPRPWSTSPSRSTRQASDHNLPSPEGPE